MSTQASPGSGRLTTRASHGPCFADRRYVFDNWNLATFGRAIISPGKNVDLLRTTAGSTQLLLDHDSFVGRRSIIDRSPLAETEIEELLDAFASVCTWTTVYYRWRPNPLDEADDHLLELAIASGAEAIVTKNVRHLRSGDLRFEQILILKPEQLLKEL